MTHVIHNVNEIYAPVFDSEARYTHIWGGRGRGGSHFATDYFLFLLTQPYYFRGYLLRQVHSDIRDSLFRDIKDRIDESAWYEADDFWIDESKMTIRYAYNDNMILSKGFKKSSSDRTAKLKSLAGATDALIEEAEEIDEMDFMQLDDSLRTVKGNIRIMMLFNPPPKNHWIIRRWYNLVPSEIDGYYHAVPKKHKDFLSIFSTYKDNKRNLNGSTIRNYIGYQDTLPDYYYTVIKGLVSEGARGRVYPDWKMIDDMPGIHNKFYGLDFGFSNDPVALVELESHGKDGYANELIYETGLTTPQIFEKAKALGVDMRVTTYADPAYPSDIRQLRDLGWNVRAAPGGKVESGIQFVRRYTMRMTERSENGWYETQEYRWKLDKNKIPIDQPVDKDNHLMDAIRYGFVGEYKHNYNFGMKTL